MMLFLHHMLKFPQFFLPARCLWLYYTHQNWLLTWVNEQWLLFYLAFNQILQTLVVKLIYRYEFVCYQTVFTRHNSMLGIKSKSAFLGHVGLITVEYALMRILLSWLCLIWQTAQRQISDPGVKNWFIACLQLTAGLQGLDRKLE